MSTSMYRPSKTRHFTGLSLLLIILLLAPACASGPTEDPEDDMAMVGAPPRNDDDSLFRFALPAEAVPAQPSGRIGIPDETEPSDIEEPITAPEEDFSDPRQDRAACFSCVRICPVGSGGHAECSDDPDDLICGWGSYHDANKARQMAQAQCDATLDMARYMPNYAEIEGSCPPATCR
jgi:hypothetical protein